MTLVATEPRDADRADVRLIVALRLGAVIGWERELQHMPAGFRDEAEEGD